MAGKKTFPPRNLEEAQAILKELDKYNPKIRILLTVMALSGLRFSDASKLKRDQVTINGHIRESFEVIQTKTYNGRITKGVKPANARTASAITIYVNDDLAAVLTKALEYATSNVIFSSTHHHAKKDTPISIQYVNSTLQKVAIKLGLKYEIGTHSLRKYFASMLLDMGADISVIMDSLGHSSVASTQHYLNTFADKRKGFNQRITLNQKL